MAGRPKSNSIWFDGFDLDREINQLIERIEKFTKFTLPKKKRELILTFASEKLGDTKARVSKLREEEKPFSTSKRAFLETMQDTIFLAIPDENVALMPLSEYVLNDPDYYAELMRLGAALSEEDLFLAISRTSEDMTVSEARSIAASLWKGSVETNARKYGEALKRPERENVPLKMGNIA